jgi:septal ring factor EnvC (AmiA/AmiB activator)
MHLTGWLKLLQELREVRQKLSALEDKVAHEARSMAEAAEAENKRQEFIEMYMTRRNSDGRESPTTPTSGST